MTELIARLGLYQSWRRNRESNPPQQWDRHQDAKTLDLMLTRGSTVAHMISSPVPVACTLNHQHGKAQALEWVDIQRLALRSAPLDTGAQMTFAADHATRIADLADREAKCCAFLNIVTALNHDEFVVEITSEDPAAISIIAGLSGVTPS